MPVRRAVELCVKTLVVNALGVLVGRDGASALSSFRYDLRETGVLGVPIMTHPGRAWFVVALLLAYCEPCSAIYAGIVLDT